MIEEIGGNDAIIIYLISYSYLQGKNQKKKIDLFSCLWEKQGIGIVIERVRGTVC